MLTALPQAPLAEYMGPTSKGNGIGEKGMEMEGREGKRDGKGRGMLKPCAAYA